MLSSKKCFDKVSLTTRGEYRSTHSFTTESGSNGDRCRRERSSDRRNRSDRKRVQSDGRRGGRAEDLKLQSLDTVVEQADKDKFGTRLEVRSQHKQ